MITTCDFCKNKINRRPSKIKKARLHFCNTECRQKYYINKKQEKNKKIRHRSECVNNFIIKDNFSIISINSKTYGNKEVLINTEQIDKASKIFWHICKRRNNYFDVVGWDKKEKKEIRLHRYLTNCSKDCEIDHINRNPLDNRLENLRCVNRSENMLNKSVQKNSLSGYKGITLRKRKNYRKYQVRITVNKKSVSLGYFNTIEEALEKRKQFCKEHSIIS